MDPPPNVAGAVPTITKHYIIHADRNGVFRATSHMPVRKGPKPEIHVIEDDSSSDVEIIEQVRHSLK